MRKQTISHPPRLLSVGQNKLERRVTSAETSFISQMQFWLLGLSGALRQPLAHPWAGGPTSVPWFLHL